MEELILGLIFSLWWVYTPVLLFFILIFIFQVYTKTKYFLNIKWILLEIKVPSESVKSPKAMENIFSALHAMLMPIKPFRDTFLKGKVQEWYSLELVGGSGEVKFFIRTSEAFRNLVETQFYANYPNCEIVVATEDHVSGLPPTLAGGEYDIFGTEFILTKEDVYPIRTYLQFEELNPARKENVQRLDPLASILEAFSRLNAGEYMGMQILARPVGDAWVKEGQKVIDKIMGKEEKKAEGGFLKFLNFIQRLLPGEAAPKEEKKEERKNLTPGQNEVLKAVEASMAKLGFETGIRFLYAASKEGFQKSHVASINGAMKQFSTNNLNGFKMNTAVTTLMAKHPFKARKIRRKKAMILRNYRLRQFVLKPGILNTEEMATVYHFPDVGVRTPFMPRIEAKKGDPPSELPVG